MGALRRPRPALLLERRRRVRPVRPLLRLRAGRQRAEPAVLGDRHARRRRRPHPRGRLRRAAHDLRPARAARRLLEVLRPGLRPAPQLRRRWQRRTRARRRSGCRSSTCRASSTTASLLRHIVDLDEYYDDLRDGTLPAVAYIAPGGSSEHPPRRPQAGQTLVRTLLTALARSSRLAALRVHVDLRRVGRLVRPRARRPGGPRLPGAGAAGQPVRAARARSTAPSLDHTSILRFIEDNWGVAPLVAARRARERASPARSTSAARRASGGDHRRPPEHGDDDASRAAGSSTSGTARRVLLAVALIAGGPRGGATPGAARRPRRRPSCSAAARRRRRPPAGAAVIQTNPPTPGMRFSVDGVPFDGGRLRAAPTRRRRWSARVTRVRALAHRPRPGRARTLRPLVRPTGASRRSTWITACGSRFVDLAGRRGRPGRGRLRDARRAATAAAARLRRRRAAVASGQPGRARERRPAVHARLLRRRARGRRRDERRAPRRSSASSRAKTPEVRLRLLLFSARFEVHDALLGFPIGSAVRLEFPDGRVAALRPGLERRADGELAAARRLPGQRRRPRDLVVAPGGALGRPARRAARDQLARHRRGRCSASARSRSACCTRAAPAACRSVARCSRCSRRGSRRSARRRDARPSTPTRCSPTTTSGSTGRRGTAPRPTIPLLGRYSSDDRGVMRQHVAWAKRAGIDGFIVSWKSTPVLNRRPRAAGRRGRRGALQAARDLPGARLLPRAAARRTRRARPRLVPAPTSRDREAFRGLPASRS